MERLHLIPHLRRSSHRKRRRDATRPSGQEGRDGRLKTALGRAFMGHLSTGRGGGEVVLSGVVSQREKRFLETGISENGNPGSAETLKL